MREPAGVHENIEAANSATDAGDPTAPPLPSYSRSAQHDNEREVSANYSLGAQYLSISEANGYFY
jgi:hypothetical protein